MSGFLFRVSSNHRIWYLLGTILFVAGGIALAIAGFVTLGATWGITGIILAVAAGILMIDAISNMM